MANMGYCRFQNTLKDMIDCLNALYDGKNPDSPEEIKAMKEMRSCCHDLVTAITDSLELLEE